LLIFNLPQEIKVFFTQESLLQEIRTTNLSASQGLLSAPAPDPLMVTRQQHVRNPTPLNILWPRIVGKLQQCVYKRVVPGRVFIAQHARNKSDDGIQEYEGRQLTPSQNVVPNGDLIRRQEVSHPFVEPLVPAANAQQVLALDKLLGNRLFERSALGGQEDQVSLLPLTETRDRLDDRLWLKHHSSATPVRSIVHDGMAIMGIAPKIVDRDLHDAPLLGSFEDAFRERSLKEPREEGENVIPPQLRSSLSAGGPP
jgi:hypothetical protein